MPRVAAIGLDAAESWWVEQLMAEGRLPRLAALRERSARVPLTNVSAYRAELAWTQFVTGRDAASNGYWSTALFDPATYTASMQGAHDGPAFWSDTDLTTVVFDVPHSVLRTDTRGLQVTAWGAHAPQYPRASLPAGLLRKIDERFGPHPAFDVDSDLGWNDVDYIERLTGGLVTGAARRASAAGWLLEQQPDWELFVTVMSETHSGPHHLWHGADPAHPLRETRSAAAARAAMLRVAEGLDQAVGTLVDGLPDDTVVAVFSLHGMEPSHDLPSLVLVPELLHRLHTGRPFLRDRGQARWLRAGMPVVDPVHRYPWAIMGSLHDRRADQSPVERVAAAIPASVHRLMRRLVGGSQKRALGEREGDIPQESVLPLDRMVADGLDLPFDWAPPVWYEQHWPSMEAFVLPSFSGDAHIRVNVAGREHAGIVPAAEFRDAGERLVAEVSRCTDPRSGAPIVAGVEWLRTSPDDYGPDADLVIRFSGPYDAIRHPVAGLIGPVPHMRAGTHTSNGFAFLSGPGIVPGELAGHSAFDLPPTLLDLAGRRAARPLSGTSFAEAVVTRAAR